MHTILNVLTILWTVTTAMDVHVGLMAPILMLLTERVSAATTVHIGIIGPFSGNWAKIGKTCLNVADYWIKWFSEEKSNTLNGIEYDIVIHHADFQTSGDRMAELVVPFAKGTYDPRTETSWKFSEYTNPQGNPGVEPAPHRLDALFLHLGSGFIPLGLQALKDDGMDIVVYACGSNSEPAWVTNGQNRWDFATNCGEQISDTEMRPTIKLLGEKEAKTIIFVEQDGAGSWTQSLCKGARAEAKAQGIEIIGDAVINFESCVPVKEDAAALAKCREKNEKLFEDKLGHLIKRANKYTADGLAMCSYGDICYWLPHYLKRENINFGTMIAIDCGAGDFTPEEMEAHMKAPETEYTLDYQLYFQYVAGADGSTYDQRYNPVGMWSEYKTKSSAGMWKEIQTHTGGDPNADGGYFESLFFNGWHLFMEDLHGAKGDLTKLGRFFGGYRPPSTSHWGILSQVPGGWSDMHKTSVVQRFPKWKNDGKVLLVSPPDVAQTTFLFPAPFWSKRACEDKCVKCARCDELSELMTVLTIALIVASVVVGVATACIAKFLLAVGNPSLAFNCSLMCGAFCLNLITDVIAILTMYAQMDEEILEKDSPTAIIYACFTVAGFIPAMARVKIQAYGIRLGLKVKADSPLEFYFRACDMIACLSGSLLDFAIFVLQGYTAILAPSFALISSMLMTGMSLGYAAGAPQTYSDACKILGLIGYKSTINWTKIMLKLFNPVDYKLIPEDLTWAKSNSVFVKGKANDEKSQ